MTIFIGRTDLGNRAGDRRQPACGPNDRAAFGPNEWCLNPLLEPCQPEAMRRTYGRKSIRILFACVSICVALPTWSWSDHASLVWPLLRT